MNKDTTWTRWNLLVMNVQQIISPTKKKLGQTDKIVKNRSISKKISPELAGGKQGAKRGQNSVFEKGMTKTFIIFFR